MARAPNSVPVIGHLLSRELWEMLGRFERACSWFPNVVAPMGEETGELAVLVDSGFGGVLVDERGQRIEGGADRSG